jgi:uncharacterized membrane protein YbhN (UPF0104 family)
MSIGADEEISTRYRMTRRIWLLMTVSSAIYLILALQINLFVFMGSTFNGFVELSPSQVNLLRALCGLLSFGAIIFAEVARRRYERQASSLERVTAGYVVAYALADLPATCGLAFHLLTGRRLEFALLMGLSLVVLLAYFPRWEEWEQRAREIEREHGGTAA